MTVSKSLRVRIKNNVRDRSQTGLNRSGPVWTGPKTVRKLSKTGPDRMKNRSRPVLYWSGPVWEFSIFSDSSKLIQNWYSQFRNTTECFLVLLHTVSIGISWNSSWVQKVKTGLNRFKTGPDQLRPVWDRFGHYFWFWLLVGFMRKSICSSLNSFITRNSHTVTFYHVKTSTDLMSTTRILKIDIKNKDKFSASC